MPFPKLLWNRRALDPLARLRAAAGFAHRAPVTLRRAKARPATAGESALAGHALRFICTPPVNLCLLATRILTPKSGARTLSIMADSATRPLRQDIGEHMHYLTVD